MDTTPPHFSGVEQTALRNMQFKNSAVPGEKIPAIVVDSFPALGKLTAMRFIEWVQANPYGVIALPTGKTPEYFIKWVSRLLTTWEEPETQLLLEKSGVDGLKKPGLKNLSFVQIDEFYPIEPLQHNSFYHYVNHFYINGFGLDPEKALLINCAEIGLTGVDDLTSVWLDSYVDLSLRYRPGKNLLERKQKSVLHRIDQWCHDYEERIRSLGGIGFFLGGIGPDGHIGFNVRGSDHFSTTRLAETNYETQAAAAGDLGGIETSRGHLVITIGLGTITYNPECTALIIAAGEAKAGIVAASIQSDRTIDYPATALQALPNARFYLTAGASRQLEGRQVLLIKQRPALSDSDIEELIIDLALKKRKTITNLSEEDFRNDRRGAILAENNPEPVQRLLEKTYKSLERKIERGMRTLDGKCFVHTEPHHDDLLLGYLPYIVRNIRSAANSHYFVTLTSGFTAVTNTYVEKAVSLLKQFLETPEYSHLDSRNYFDPSDREARNRDVWQYLDGVAAASEKIMDEGTMRRLLRNLIELYGETGKAMLKLRISKLLKYFQSSYPGKKDSGDIQRLKGMCREWEAECLWGYFGWSGSNIRHLRLGFYTGDIFTEEPTVDRDARPILETFEETAPDIVTTALDPEASGPDTHYKALQAFTEALKLYEEKTGRADIRVWGYRNVWYRFHPSEANIFVPVSLNMFSIMENAFMNTFISQKQASFPSYEHDGPFSGLAQKIQVEQYQKLKTCLGRTWFNEHPSALVRATRGLVFLKEMTLDELYSHSRILRKSTENR
ncbi:glucosamine-6-phosphate deaminase [candidate division KSB1 bacterium]